MAKSAAHVADLGLQVRDYLEGSEAKQSALRQRIWKVCIFYRAFQLMVARGC